MKAELEKLKKYNLEGENEEEIRQLEITIKNYEKELKFFQDFKMSPKNESESESELSDAVVKNLINSIFKNSEEKNIKEVAKILKNEKISQVILHSQENFEQSEKFGLSLKRDLDTQTALYLLNNLVNKPDKELYREDAVFSFIPKGGTIKNIEEAAQRNGARVLIDAGGSWLRAEGTNGTKTIYLDHHGTGQHDPTSATEITYKVLKEADLLKEPEPAWLKKYIDFVNEFDNLTYLDKKDEKGNKIFNENYFEKEWSRTPYALADFAPMELLKAYKSGKIKNLSTPFTIEQVKEIGGEKLVQKSEEINFGAKRTINSIRNAERNNKKEGLNLANTRIGKIIYHNFPKIKPLNGKEFVNKIDNNLAVSGTMMSGSDAYLCWNKQNGIFFISSKHPNLEEVIEDLGKASPGCITKDVRGNIIFGKITKEMTEEKFLNTIDPKILKNVRPKNWFF